MFWGLFSSLLDVWDLSNTVFALALAMSILIMLYAITLIHNKLRLMESELQSLRKDQAVLSEELEVMVSSIQQRFKAREGS